MTTIATPPATRSAASEACPALEPLGLEPLGVGENILLVMVVSVRFDSLHFFVGVVFPQRSVPRPNIAGCAPPDLL